MITYHSLSVWLSYPAPKNTNEKKKKKRKKWQVHSVYIIPRFIDMSETLLVKVQPDSCSSVTDVYLSQAFFRTCHKFWFTCPCQTQKTRKKKQKRLSDLWLWLVWGKSCVWHGISLHGCSWQVWCSGSWGYICGNNLKFEFKIFLIQ